MNKCPNCQAALSADSNKCQTCGFSVTQEFAATVQKPQNGDDDQTPTKFQQTPDQIHTTTSPDGGRFVAGTVLANRYRILGLLGRGGMGEVYRAEDLELNQTVALKFLPESFAADKAALARFRGEVRNARQVSHPNVCRVFDIGETDGVYYLSMEYVDGDDLSQLLRRIGRLPSDKAVEISRQICLGLHAIHDAGILHRDLKPANIIIDSRGKARITDFGIAGIEQEIQSKKEIVGTPAYMSPEQITGGEVTAKSDVYSLGLLLYEIFTGKQAFRSDSIPELVRLHQNATAANPSTLVENMNPLVEKTISRCLEKQPDDRPRSALQVALMLPGGNPLEAALAAGETPSPEMIAAIPKKGALKPKVALTILLLILAGFALLVVRNQQIYTYSLTPLKKSPEILAERAKAVVKNLGYTQIPADAKYKFQGSNGFLRYVSETKAITNPRERLRAGQPFDFYFVYRQSPGYLAAWSDSKISEQDPPLTVPGMVNVSLDTRGRLIEFLAVANETIKKSAEPQTPEWTKLFAEAELDIKNFQQTEPQRILTVPADAQAAWQGTLAAFPDMPIRIEAAALNGEPVYFGIFYSWDNPAGADQSPADTSAKPAQIAVIFIYLSILIGAVLLARRNYKAGHSDLKGGFKLAVICFLGFSLSAFINASHVPSLAGEVNVFFKVLSTGLYLAAIIGVIYLALEPFARRWWSELLISWNRLLAGDFRDPMIGRDILIGALGAVGMNLLAYSGHFINERFFGAGEEVSGNFILETLDGWSGVISRLFAMFALAPLFGLGCFFLLLLFYIVFRNKKISMVLLSLIVTVPSFLNALQSGEWLFTGFTLIFCAVMAFILTRFGLLAVIFLFVYMDLSLLLPTTFDTSNHLFPGTLMVFAAAAGLAIYGFYTSIAGQPVFQRNLLTEE
jgi:serine/threonine protein kinase